eukprot:33268_1
MDQVFHICTQFEQLSASQFETFHAQCIYLRFIRTLIRYGIYHLALIKTRHESNETANTYINKIEELIKNIRIADENNEESEAIIPCHGIQSLDSNLQIHLCQYMDSRTFHVYKRVNKSICSMVGSKGLNYLYSPWFDTFWLTQKCCKLNEAKMIQLKAW